MFAIARSLCAGVLTGALIIASPAAAGAATTAQSGNETAQTQVVENTPVADATPTEQPSSGAPDTLTPEAEAASEHPFPIDRVTMSISMANARIAGSSRYTTAAQVSQKLNRPTGGVVVLVSGENFPDALSVSGPAANIGAPILLVQSTGIPQATKTELLRLQPKHVLVVGGTNAVPASVDSWLDANLPNSNVVRASGSSRYATNAAITSMFYPGSSSEEVFIATGVNFPDALSGSAAAARLDAPLLLIQGQTIPAHVQNELRRLAPRTIYILGQGTSDSTIAQLRSLSGASSVQVIGGRDRYATSAAIATKFFGGYSQAVVASGASFPDALVAAPLSKAVNRPIVLAEPSPCTISDARAAIYRTITTRLVIGGQNAVPDATLRVDKSSCLMLEPNVTGSLTVLVNKKNPLKPTSYVPGNLVDMRGRGVPVTGSNTRLRKDAADALVRMHQGARSAGTGFNFVSGYRSYATQSALYNNYVRQYGRAYADRISARPGYSEHQTGLAVDISTGALTSAFGNTTSGKWLAANSWKYGFILRYPSGSESVTGFAYEPWHFRYVGVPAATAYKKSGKTTWEQFLGKPAAPSY